MVLKRCEMLRDGCATGWHLKRRGCTVKGICFGEEVMLRRKHLPNRASKLTSFWEGGVYLGMRAVSGEMLVGCWRRRTCTGDGDSGGPSVRAQPNEGMNEERVEVESVAAAEAVPRRASIAKVDLEMHGFTIGCPGCRARPIGRSRRGRSVSAQTGAGDEGRARVKVGEGAASEILERVLRHEVERREKRKDSLGDERSEKADTKDSGLEIEGAGASSSPNPMASSSSLAP